MRNFSIKKRLKNRFARVVKILIVSIVPIYLLISLYFMNHCFFGTVINGVDVSLKAHEDVEDIIKSYAKSYKLQLIERNAEIEEISGCHIGLQYNQDNSISKVYRRQFSLKWLSSLFKKQDFFVDDLFVYNQENLESRINQLNCLNKDIIEPQSASFRYLNGSFEGVEEVYGNKIYRVKLNEAIEMSVLSGNPELDLNLSSCYANPKYALSSKEAFEAMNLLNKYVSTSITYIFRSEYEILDRNTINQWLSVDEALNVVIDEKAVKLYIQRLGRKYDTAGATRTFKTSTYKTVEVKGGFYGWKIDSTAETEALLDSIKRGETLEKEPIYIQKALSRDKNDIGNTYVEINLTKQHLWFYKDGKLITQGAVVTGNPNNGNSTKVGTYMLNYKEKGSVLRGHNYEAEVTYWMPFNGNIGIHDASWRYSFGRDIYKRNGTHGCVNVPLYLAKKLYDNIEDGTPVICYEE